MTEANKSDQPLGLASTAGLGPLPEPDGWIYDGHPDGLQFKRQAVAGIEALVRSSAPMFTAHQMRAYAAQQLAAERESIKARLLGMDDAANGRHNYYAHAAWVLFERA